MTSREVRLGGRRGRREVTSGRVDGTGFWEHCFRCRERDVESGQKGALKGGAGH